MPDSPTPPDHISAEALESWLEDRPLAIVLFKSPGCGVCSVHQRELEALASTHDIPFRAIDLSQNRQLAAPQMVLNVPVTKLFAHGKEVFKEGAYLNLQRFRQIVQDYLDHQSDNRT